MYMATTKAPLLPPNLPDIGERWPDIQDGSQAQARTPLMVVHTT